MPKYFLYVSYANSNVKSDTALKHRCTGIFFAKNTLLEKIVRKPPAVKWSQTTIF